MDNKELLDQLEGIRKSLVVFETTLSDESLYIYAETARSIKQRVMSALFVQIHYN